MNERDAITAVDRAGEQLSEAAARAFDWIEGFFQSGTSRCGGCWPQACSQECGVEREARRLRMAIRRWRKVAQ